MSEVEKLKKEVKSLRKKYKKLKKKEGEDKKTIKKAKKVWKKAKKRLEELERNVSKKRSRDEEEKIESEKKKAKVDDGKFKAWRETNYIVVENVGSDDCVYESFEDLRKNIDPSVMKIIDDAGFQKPTPIQAQCWPLAIRGRDVVGVAETGSGKTLAFLIPALSKLVGQSEKRRNKKKKKGPGQLPPVGMLVLSPTRELAMQIQDVADEACKVCGLTSLCVYGGVPKYTQLAALRKGVDVCVATPGRLRDLVENSGLDLSLAKFFVLDEADRMLDLGFMPEIRAIASHLPSKENRQSLMYTATWPNAVRKLAEEFVNNPVKVTVGSDVLTANHRVTQHVEVMEQREKDMRLQNVLQKYCGNAQKHKKSNVRVLVFVLYKKEAARVESSLKRRGWNCVAIHGDKGQRDRTAALEQFRSGRTPMLVATDVAARGLDIPDVKFVINYSFPLTIEDYIHRIGRTGRAGKTGVSHTFFTRDDKARAAELTNILREAGQVIPPDLSKFGLYTKKKTHNLYGAHFKDVDMTKKATRITFDD